MRVSCLMFSGNCGLKQGLLSTFSSHTTESLYEVFVQKIIEVGDSDLFTCIWIVWTFLLLEWVIKKRVIVHDYGSGNGPASWLNCLWKAALLPHRNFELFLTQKVPELICLHIYMFWFFFSLFNYKRQKEENTELLFSCNESTLLWCWYSSCR